MNKKINPNLIQTAGWSMAMYFLITAFIYQQRAWLAGIAVLIAAAAFCPPAPAADEISGTQTNIEKRSVIRGSGDPVPRFVSLKKDVTNMRVGPGREYPLDWVYVRAHLPLKIVSEFDVWRKVVDHEGVTGWIHSSLLSSKRYAVIIRENTRLHVEADSNSDLAAIAGREVVLEIQYCRKQWCRLAAPGIRGWTERANFWGLLPNEELDPEKW